MAHCLFAVEHFDSKFVKLITKLSMCNEFFHQQMAPKYLFSYDSHERQRQTQTFPSCFDLFCFWVNKPTFIILTLVPTRLKMNQLKLSAFCWYAMKCLICILSTRHAVICLLIFVTQNQHFSSHVNHFLATYFLIVFISKCRIHSLSHIQGNLSRFC